MKVVLAYSGGLDTSVILQWIKETYNAEVICFAADVGQEEELKGLKAKARKSGALKCYVDDLREEFARDFVFPMIRAGAVYESGYLLGTSIARPLIAKRMVEIAVKEGADAIAHGATGKGNDQVRFELTAYALRPNIKVIAPWREERYRKQFSGRNDMLAYCEKHGIPVEASAKKPYSMDRNLLHISFEGGILEDPWNEPPADMFKLSVSPERAPAKPEYVEIEFKAGNAVAVNGKKLSPLGVMQALNKLGGKHGVGRIDLVENRFVGMKSRGVYETPGGTILYRAREAVEQLTMDREVLHLRNSLVPQYAKLVYNGFWFAPEREMLQAAMDDAAATVTGTARIKLFKGSATVVGRKAAKSLYDPHMASFEGAGGYDQSDATGFIKLNALRLRVRAKTK
ncbi:MAG: argininosuccinate synthase [Kiritimatiellae bacterium]|nr:argininosuccinate synthase [Kiritimatiellia bacterium]MCO5062379.1 argininosuccinate synthase [Kiritimatiellia bacterium]MCO5068625.1 argininosuccinate synthase [Kiritimatiellia bacterium]MCO6400595.1 argininosuccinate synthase [Verrucomicrobiota bacterium]